MTDLLCIGDSWIECDEDYKWPVLLGVPPSLRQGVGGTTAHQWASDHNGMLTRAINTPADDVFVSVGGNDLRNALADFIKSRDKAKFGLAVKAMQADTASVIARFAKRDRVFVIQYDASIRVQPVYALLSQWGNRMVEQAAVSVAGARIIMARFDTVLAGPADFQSDGFHPSKRGHQKIAAYMTTLLNK